MKKSKYIVKKRIVDGFVTCGRYGLKINFGSWKIVVQCNSLEEAKVCLNNIKGFYDKGIFFKGKLIYK